MPQYNGRKVGRYKVATSISASYQFKHVLHHLSPYSVPSFISHVSPVCPWSPALHLQLDGRKVQLDLDLDGTGALRRWGGDLLAASRPKALTSGYHKVPYLRYFR
jgi:hypothetical protein